MDVKTLKFTRGWCPDMKREGGSARNIGNLFKVESDWWKPGKTQTNVLSSQNAIKEKNGIMGKVYIRAAGGGGSKRRTAGVARGKRTVDVASS